MTRSKMGWLVGAVGIELLEALRTRKLLIIDSPKRQRGEKPEKRRTEVHVGYTPPLAKVVAFSLA
ncbi:MAG: hypothetical protein DMG41_33305 [Acidobacteria bacterium]|nr:MAG: hypothetical protein DMG42_12730 [Acidobacteriota bacterium]PYT82412.1 MAG: hypothetical protein DMG41_33305 [Acidobacteriota bacterium]